MVKAIALIKRKPGLSREEFVRHYEEVHAPLALKYFPTFKRYVRNYVLPVPGIEDAEFDCLTEVWYDNMEGYQSVINVLESESGQAIKNDAETFMDTSKQISFLVKEKVSK